MKSIALIPTIPLTKVRETSVYLVLFLAGVGVPMIFSSYFYEMFLTPKWLIIYSVAIIMLISVILEGDHKYKTPSIMSTSRFLIGVFIAAQLLALVHPNTNFLTKNLLDRTSFFIILLWSFNVFKSRKSYLNYFIHALTISALMVTIYMLVHILLPNIKIFADPLSSTFGNYNMVAEFIGITAILLVGQYLRHSPRQRHLWQLSPLIFFIPYLIFLQSRSALIAMWISTAYLIYKSSLKNKSKIFFIFSPLLLFALLYYLNKLGVGSIDFFTQGKIKSIFDRGEIFWATLKMIQEHPWGVGIGMFDYAFIPFKMQSSLPVSELEIERSPHNEWLRYLSEDGILLTVLGLGVWISLIKERLSSVSKAKNSFIVGFFIFIFIQSFVQFPLENPIPLLITAIIAGYFFAVTEPKASTIVTQFPLKGWFIAPLTALYAYFALVEGMASYLIARDPNALQTTAQACRLTPHNWMHCLYALENELEQGNSGNFYKDAHQELKLRPYNFPVLYLLGESYIRDNKMQLGCRYWEQYDKIFHYQSSKHHHIQAVCGTRRSS